MKRISKTRIIIVSKKGDMNTSALLKTILALVSVFVILPLLIAMSNMAEYKHDRINCQTNAIIRDKMLLKDYIYDLDCDTTEFRVEDTQILYGDKKLEGYKEERAQTEFYTFLGSEVVAGWNAFGQGKLDVADTKIHDPNQCVIFSAISVESEDIDFSTETFMDHIKTTDIRSNNKKQSIYDFLKADNGNSIFYIPKDFDNQDLDQVYLVYVASEDEKEYTDSRYSIFLGHGDDVSKECDMFIS